MSILCSFLCYIQSVVCNQVILDYKTSGFLKTKIDGAIPTGLFFNCHINKALATKLLIIIHPK